MGKRYEIEVAFREEGGEYWTRIGRTVEASELPSVAAEAVERAKGYILHNIV